MKWSDMHKTVKDDEDILEDHDSDEEATKNDPNMRYEVIPHKGCVNRIRSMYGTNVVATWNDEGEVGIYDVRQALEALETPEDSKQKKNFGGSKLAAFKHKDEGYALDWSPFTYGRLAAGCCNA
jgi:ribosome assembly protein RRB1